MKRLLGFGLLLPLVAASPWIPLEDHDEWKARLADDGRQVALADVSENDCLRCHQAIGEEWRHSTHATAWQDEHYQAALKRIRRKQGCWGCHAPEPLAAAGWPQKPKARTGHRHLGVDCATCHLAADGESILGPAGHPNEAHASEAHEVFDDSKSNALCIACHATNIGPVIGVAKDFQDSDQAGFGSSCVDCHMGRVTRAWAEPWEAGQDPLPERRGRSHRIKGPRDPKFLEDAFGLDVKFTDTAVRLGISNQTGHRVPGLQERLIRFELRLVDASGEELATGQRDFDYRAYLPVEDEVFVELDGKGSQLIVRGLHTPPGAKQAQVFLTREFDSAGESVPKD